MTKPWDTPGLPPRAEQDRCPTHKGLCAYRDDDPARCPVCHRSWTVIEGRDGEQRDAHYAQHSLAGRKKVA